MKHFLCLLLIFLKISKDSSASYYQNNKKRLQKEAFERYQSFSKEEKEKSNSTVLSNTKSTRRSKQNKSLLSIEKNITKGEKTPYYNHKKLFSFRKSTSLLKK